MKPMNRIKVSEWTPDQALAHLRITFEQACALDPDLMEPYTVMRAETGDPVEEMAIMREALRSTIAERYKYTLEITPKFKRTKRHDS